MEQGIGALTSDAGRAAQAKTAQMQKGGASLDQIQQELYGSVMKGLLPFQVAAELFQQLKQPPKEPAAPPSGTVVNDMAKVLANRNSGVASLPAPAMDQAQFAGGGIVAFADGNLVPSGGTNYPVVPYRAAASRAGALVPAAAQAAGKAGRWMIGKGPLLTAAGLAATALPFFLGGDDKVEAEPEAGKPAAPPKTHEMPEDSGTPQVALPQMNGSSGLLDAEIVRQRRELEKSRPLSQAAYTAEQRQMLEAAGLGKLTKQREEALAKREAEYEQEKGKAGLMSLARAGFEMAANASQAGSTFFGSAASGALQGLQHYGETKERLRQVNAGIQDAQFQLAEAGALREYAALQGGAQLKREADKTFADRSAALADLVTRREQLANQVTLAQFQAATQVAIANANLLAQRGEHDLARQVSQLVARSTQLWKQGKTTESQEFLDRAQAIVNSTAPQVLSKEAGKPNMGGVGVNTKEYGDTVTVTPTKSED